MTYEWSFTDFNCYVEYESKSKVVYVVHWLYTANEGDVSSSVVGMTSLTFTAGDPFIEFVDLTAEDVQGWVEAVEDMDALKATVRSKVREIQNPTIETLGPPWANGA